MNLSGKAVNYWLQELKIEKNNLLVWLLIPLLTYLAWRFSRKQRVNNRQQTVDENDDGKSGLDSPLYAVLEKLEQETDSRRKGETLINWIKRVLPDQRSVPYLNVAALHYRYRFQPDGDKATQKAQLSEAISSINQY